MYLTLILYFGNLDNPKFSLVPRNLDFKMEKINLFVLFSSYDYLSKYDCLTGLTLCRPVKMPSISIQTFYFLEMHLISSLKY